MNPKDYIGKRGENIFRVLITEFCDGMPLFDDAFLGEKHEATDSLVELINPTSGHAYFFAQIKSTTSRYTGLGAARKLDVRVTKRDVEKLKKVPAPIYVFGIDIEKQRGYIMAITRRTTGGISGIPTKNSLSCRSLKMLWKEVDDYWTAKRMLVQDSVFTN